MKKLLLIILTIFYAQTIIAQAGQQWLQKKLSISAHQVPIEEVLKQLEKEMDGVVFAYSPSTFDVKQSVTIEAKDKPLIDILHEVFKGKPLEAKEVRGRIFLMRKKNSTTGKQSKALVRKKRALLKKIPEVPKASKSISSQGTDQSEKKEKQAQTEGVPKVSNSEGVKKDPVQDLVIDTTGTSNLPASSDALLPEEEIDTIQDKLEIPQKLPVKSIQIDRKKLLSTPFYNLPLLSQPVLLPVPIDTSLIQTEVPEMVKEKQAKKKKEKKEKPEREPEEKKFRFYIAPTGSVTQINGKVAAKIGGRLVWLKNSRFGIGLSGSALVSQLVDDQVLNNNYRTVGGYGGLFLEYNLQPHKKVHLSFPVTLALGAITYLREDIGVPPAGTPAIEDERILGLIEPGILVELNVWKYIKIGFEVNYRYTTFSELNYTDTGDTILSGTGLNGFSAGITLKLGIF